MQISKKYMDNIKPDLLIYKRYKYVTLAFVRKPFHSNGFDEGCLQLILRLRLRRCKSDEGCLRHFSQNGNSSINNIHINITYK